MKKFVSFVAVLGLVLGMLGMGGLAYATGVDDGFDPNADDAVYSIAVQSDGKILLGGAFTSISGTARNRIARLNSDGSLDATFNPNVNNTVLSIAIQQDGKILIGGDFTQIGGTARNYVARLNSDGSLDATFDPNANSSVYSIAIQQDGKILIGGEFTQIGVTTRNRIARLNSDGSLDTTFDPNANSSVYSMVTQPDGKILIGGGFTTIGGTARNKIARLNSDGGLDTTFDPNANGPVYSIVIQPDGKILIGGYFTQIGVTTRNRIARLNSDGSLDTAFDPNANWWVRSIAIQPDGKILIGGLFTQIGVTARNYIARLYPDGSLDATFDPSANGNVYSIALQPDGKILIGGEFTTIGGTARNYIARLNPDGSLDTTFNPNANNYVYSIALQPDGKILIGGVFTSIGGTIRNKIARLNADGSLDATFDPNANSTVRSIALQQDGKILIGGLFTTIGGTARNRIARLNADGSLDATFDPNANSDVYSIALQQDGKILIGGLFTTIGGTARNYIARLNADGSLDTTFDPNANSSVYSIALQPDGKILIGGVFTSIGGTIRNRIARLNADGSLDTTFNPNANGNVYFIALQQDGKIFIGGAFTTIGGTARNYIARLNSDGSLDTTFNPSANNYVYSIALQQDGKILIGGAFTTIGGTARNRIARLSTQDASLQELQTVNNTAVRWMGSGAGPELDCVWFGSSTNLIVWTEFGTGTRITGGWEKAGISLPFNTNIYIRARGYAKGGLCNASTSLIESVRLFHLNVLTVTADFSGTPTAGCVPLTVDFADSSTGNVLFYLWDFGDGDTSTASNPQHIYTNPGIYTVSLTVSDTCGSDSMEISITVNPPPTANASADDASICSGSCTTLHGYASGDSPSYTFAWTYPGGSIANDSNPEVCPDTTTTYTLTVTDDNGCQDSDSVTVTVSEDIWAVITSSTKDPNAWYIWGESVSKGEVICADLNDDYSDYETPWCSGWDCCNSQEYNRISLSRTKVSNDEYIIHGTGGISGGSWWYDTEINVSDEWKIVSLEGSIGSTDEGAYYEITPDGKSIHIHGGLSYSGCVCSDCGRNNYDIKVLLADNCTPMPSGMISWWDAEGNANDIIGTNHGTMMNGATFAAGKVGQTFSFDGTNDWVSTNLDVQPVVMPSTTWDAWVYPTRVNHNPRQTIFSNDDGNFDRTVVIEMGTSNFGVFTGTGVWQPTGVTLNQWQHIAVVYTPTNIEFYKDGVKFSYGIAPVGQGTTRRFSIGANPGYGEFFQGLIDEVGIYNRALTDSEIAAIYNARSAGKCRVECSVVADAGAGDTICPGICTILEGSASGGYPPYSYSWTPDDGSLSDTGDSNPTACPDTTTTYTLTVTDDNGCTDADQVVVTVSPCGCLDTIYVDTATGNDVNSGDTWGSAKKTITAGVDAVCSGGTVYVAAGTYNEGDSTTLTKPVNLVGVDSSTTTIQGSSPVVVFDSVGGSISGFTITGGTGGDGYGIWCKNGASPTITNNTISGNLHGIYCFSSSPDITDNTISGNGSSGIFCSNSSSPTITNNIISGNSYGIYCSFSSPTINHNTILWNSKSGIECYSSSPTITDNTITGNYYGILCDQSSSPTIANNTITGNSHTGIASYNSSSPPITNNIISENNIDGIYCGGFASPTITNNIITANSQNGIFCAGNSPPTITNNTITGNNQHGIWCYSSSSPTITNNIITSNISSGILADSTSSPVIGYNDVWDNSPNYSGTASAGTSDISADPKFENASDSNNYRLLCNSPCINTGSDTADSMPAIDKDGYPRPYPGDNPDMGAYEYQGTSCAATLILTKSSDPVGDTNCTRQVFKGDTITYSLNYECSGGAATNVKLIDYLDSGVDLIDTGGGTLNGSTLTWNLGNLSPGNSATLTFTCRVTADPVTCVKNYAQIWADNVDTAYSDTITHLVVEEAPPSSEHVQRTCQFIVEERPEKLYDVMTVGDYAYLAYESGLYIADVSDKINPRIVGVCPTPDEARAVHVRNNYAYVAAYTKGLRIINIGNPRAPFEAGSLDTEGSAKDVVVQGDYAYLAAGGSGLQIIDVSDPSAPFKKGSYNTQGQTQGVHVLGNYAYIADSWRGLAVIDVSSPSAPQEAGFYGLAGEANGVYVVGNYAYVADGWGGLRIVDVGNPSSLDLVSSYSTPGSAKGVYTKGDYAYIADGTKGLYVIDISSPSHPWGAGFYNTEGFAYNVYVADDNYVYLADGENGLEILWFEFNPPQPEITTTSLLDGVQDQAYSESLTATGGASPYVWTVISGDLPTGFTLSGTGLISGTPTVSGKFDFTVEVQCSDTSLPSDTAALSITIRGLDADDLKGVITYPNPFKPSKGHLEICFDRLTAEATIKIFDIAGELVRKIEERDGDGKAAWDTKNEKGKKVASGIYIYLVTNPAGQKCVGKIGIIR